MIYSDVRALLTDVVDKIWFVPMYEILCPFRSKSLLFFFTGCSTNWGLRILETDFFFVILQFLLILVTIHY